MGARPVWRVRDRASFDALRRDGRRARRGPVAVTFVPGAEGVPRAAFAVGRSVGSAVARNRARRRLRAVVDELARAGALGVAGAGGTFLVAARSDLSELTFPELRSAVASAVSTVSAASAVAP